MSVLGTVLCIILAPILILNIALIVRSFTNPDEVPQIGTWLPLVVLTDSMYPEIQSGDLILCQVKDTEEVQVRDVISFFDPAGNGTSVVTHRVTDILRENGKLYFTTKGDANNAPDPKPVPAEKLVGIYHARIGGLGNAIMFMQTTQGLLLCVVLPIVLLMGYDIIRRRKFEKSKQQDTEMLLKEPGAKLPLTLVTEANFSLSTTEDGSGILYMYTLSAGHASIWDNRSSALVITMSNPDQIPADLSLSVLSNGKTTVLPMKQDCQFILPLGILTRVANTVELQFHSSLIHASNPNGIPLAYTVAWKVSNSSAGVSPLNGQLVGGPLDFQCTLLPEKILHC